MSRFVFAVVACLLGSASAAQTDCNPPPPGLSFEQWTQACPREIDYAYQMFGGGMDYDYFVESLYSLYLNPPQQGYGGVTPMAACSPDGATQCNSSGWLYTCTNGQWLTGSVKCGE